MCMDERLPRSDGSEGVEAVTPSRSTSLAQILENLLESGFYWRNLSKEQAHSLLQGAIAGSFLLRDSSHPRYLFTLTLRTFSGVTNIRIVMEKGRYQLEAYNSEKNENPTFETVLTLMNYYVKLSREICEQKRFKERGKDYLYLTKPIYKKVCSLQHLCRRTINQNLHSGGILQLPIPEKTKIYLSHYPLPV